MEQNADPHMRDDTASPLRQLPNNVEAEQALLGALLVNNKGYEQVAEFLRPEHFFNPVHGRIYAAIGKLTDRGQLATPITLKNFFEQDGDLANVGGAEYLADLAASVVTVSNSGDFGHTIHDLYLRRELVGLGETMMLEAGRPQVDVSAANQIEEAEKRLYDLATVGDWQGGAIAFHEAMKRAIDMAAAAYKRDSQVTGVTTGLRDMDAKLGGLQKSDLVIVAGRPSMGKTALATNMAFNAARAFASSGGEAGAAIAFFSLEMSAEQLANRILAEVSEVPSDRIRRGDIKNEDFARFVEAANQLASVPFFIDDTPALSIAAVRTRARRLQRQHKIGLIVVDYLQLLRGSGNKGPENRVMEISEITRGLKAIAKELEVPVLALSQLSRAVEQRDDKRPQLSDLRESGTIEQDADVVMFIFREQYYLERAEPGRKSDEGEDKFNDRYARWQANLATAHNIAEVIIAKQRHGPTGSIKLYFDGALTRFADLDTSHMDGAA